MLNSQHTGPVENIGVVGQSHRNINEKLIRKAIKLFKELWELKKQIQDSRKMLEKQIRKLHQKPTDMELRFINSRDDIRSRFSKAFLAVANVKIAIESRSVFVEHFVQTDCISKLRNAIFNQMPMELLVSGPVKFNRKITSFADAVFCIMSQAEDLKKSLPRRVFSTN